MAIEQAFVTPALTTWRSNLKSIEDLFAGMSDEQLLNEFLPGKNRYVYLMGHLAAVHDRMLTLLGIGQRLHPELDQPFLTSKDRASETPPVTEIRKAWVEINAALNAAMEALPAAAWLDKHTSVSDEDFAKEPHRNRFNVLLSRTNHLWYHYGQLILAPKAG